MKKNISEEAYYERMKALADVNGKSSIKSKNNSLGTLINYKKAGDGVTYGIIKENHNYYIKKGGLKENPDVSDFAYIGGLENIKDYQYNSLAEADKQRNMILNVINEGHSPNAILSQKKAKINENAEDEIEKASSMVDDLEAKTNIAKDNAEVEPEIDADVDLDLEIGDEPEAQETNDKESPETDDEPESEDNVEATDEPETDADLNIEIDEPTKEIEKQIGKVTNKIRNTELTPIQTKSFVNSFLSAFKDKLPEVEIEDRKVMANKILKVVPDEEMEDLGDNVEATDDEISENEMCSECGSFAQYAESRGYTTESIMECDEEEMSSLIGGYATAHNDDMNNGDLDTVSLFISLMPKIVDILKSEYGHDDYAEKLEPHIKPEDEVDKDEITGKVNELFAGLSNIGKKAKEKVAGAVKGVGDKIGSAAQGIKQSYYAGEKNAALDKLQTIATDLGKQIATVNKNAQKAGHNPININSILTTIKNQVGSKGSADLAKYRTAEEVEADDNEIMVEGEKKPSAGLSKEKKSEIVKKAKKGEDIGKTGKNFEKIAKKATKEYGDKETGEKVAAAAMWKNVKRENKEETEKSLVEQKLRKYIRNRLEEKAGKRKVTINESKKSDKLKKLDKIIDEQFSKISK